MRISVTAVLAPYLNSQISRGGLERDIYEPTAIDLLTGAMVYYIFSRVGFNCPSRGEE